MSQTTQTPDTAIEIEVVDRNGKKSFQLTYDKETIVLTELDSMNFDKGQPTIYGTVSKVDGTVEKFWIQQTGGMGGYPSIDLSKLFSAKAKHNSTNMHLYPSDFELGDRIKLNGFGDTPFVPTWICEVKTHSSYEIV